MLSLKILVISNSFYLRQIGANPNICNTNNNIDIGCNAVLLKLKCFIRDNKNMILILRNLYCVQYFSTVPFDGSSTTVLVQNYRTRYKITVMPPLCFPESAQASKLHNLSIH